MMGNMTNATASKTFRIEPLGAFSLEASGDFIGGSHPAPADSASLGGVLHLAFSTDGDWRPVGVALTQTDGGTVHGEVFGAADPEAVRHQIARILSLDVDGCGWPDVGRRDPVVAELQRMFPGFRPANWANAYEAAAWSIISARINMRQAAKVKERISRELGHEVEIHGRRLWIFPEPARLAALESFPGLFGRKAEYLRELGRAAFRGELDTDALRALPAGEALARLRALKGIGEFGAQLVRLRAVGAVDELPTVESRLLAVTRVAYGLPAEPDEAWMRERARVWSPYTMWVCVCLRRTATGTAGMMHSRATGGEK
jgi:DNA-3-methyladenine glycosylase II